VHVYNLGLIICIEYLYDHPNQGNTVNGICSLDTVPSGCEFYKCVQISITETVPLIEIAPLDFLVRFFVNDDAHALD
jgi:hypothetical protein